MFIKLYWKRLILYVMGAGILVLLCLLLIDYHVSGIGAKYMRNTADIPEVDAIIIFGAYVMPDGTVWEMLGDRLDYGYNLYREKKSLKILVSGDHGKITYDEVNNMRKYLQAKGVPREDIFMDHAGFDTYDTLYRAKDVFMVKKAVLVTQGFQLERALYIAEKLGIEA